VTPPPAQPKIYHITHVDNLARIAASGELLSDGLVAQSGGAAQVIGMSKIKRRRIEELEVPCHPRTKVGDYVPFYFCPRSVMLYVIHMANHPELSYRGGQGPIVHLEADLHRIIRWAEENGRRWAFSLSNAGASYAPFRSRIEDLRELDWTVIAATDFRAAEVKEGKQAEFLVHERFPFDLIERIGVHSTSIRVRALDAIARLAPRPAVDVQPDWYY
jgi:hypothetical protein